MQTALPRVVQFLEITSMSLVGESPRQMTSESADWSPSEVCRGRYSYSHVSSQLRASPSRHRDSGLHSTPPANALSSSQLLVYCCRSVVNSDELAPSLVGVKGQLRKLGKTVANNLKICVEIILSAYLSQTLGV